MEADPRAAQLVGGALVNSVARLPRGHTRIETTFRYPDGSAIELFLREGSMQSSDLLRAVEPPEITDFGGTLTWLSHLGIDPFRNSRRLALLRRAIEVYGVREAGGALYTRVRGEAAREMEQAIVDLAQACLRVADLAYTARFVSTYDFRERVEEALSRLDLAYEANAKLPGPSQPIVVDFHALPNRGRPGAAIMLLPTNAGGAPIADRVARVVKTFSELRFIDWPGRRVAALDERDDVYPAGDIRHIESYAAIVRVGDEDAVRQILGAGDAPSPR